MRSEPTKKPHNRVSLRKPGKKWKVRFYYDFARWGWDAKGWSPTTRDKYARRIRQADEWLLAHEDVSVFGASFELLKKHLFTCGSTARNRNNARQALLALGEFMVDHGLWSFNPADALPRLREPHSVPKALTRDEASQILRASKALGTVYEAMIAVFIYAGLRRDEAVNLEWDDLGTDLQWIRVRGKGNKERVLPINEELRRVLNVWKAQCEGPWVFPSTVHKGRHMSAQHMFRKVKDIASFAGVEGVHPHMLRHTFATCFLETGANLRLVQEAMGHADPKTTALYTRIRPEGLREAMAELTFRPKRTV